MEKQLLSEKCREQQKKFDYRLDLEKPIIVHVDGRAFSKLIKNRFEKPFDANFIKMMNETAKYLCENIQGVKYAYVQSDEINLLLMKERPESDIFFGGRLCKMQSIIASMATAKFNRLMLAYNSDDIMLYQFDCKVWNVENYNDAVAWFLFRNIDCVRNSKQQFAQTYAPHNALLNKTTDEQIAYVKETEEKDWNLCPDFEKYGRILKKGIITNKDNTGAVRTTWYIMPGADFTNKEYRDEYFENY